jgi:hypothetical protein
MAGSLLLLNKKNAPLQNHAPCRVSRRMERSMPVCFQTTEFVLTRLAAFDWGSRINSRRSDAGVRGVHYGTEGLALFEGAGGATFFVEIGLGRGGMTAFSAFAFFSKTNTD